jgi:hypothetical protein
VRDSELGINLMAVITVIALCTAVCFISACLFAWAWNLVVPLLWHAAPRLTWVHAVAIGFVFSLVRGLVTVNVNKK